MNPLVSVIVPAYNSSKTLPRCVESLLGQNYSNIEIILIDDGSLDDTGAICEDFSRRYERIRFLQQKNGGVSKARNCGMTHCMGEYLCFVDADDYVDDNYIQNFISGLTPQTDLVFQGINEIHDGGLIVKKIPDAYTYRNEEVLDGISDINKLSMFGYVCNKLYKRSIIENQKLLFDEKLNLSEDRLFALHYLKYVREMQVVAFSSYFYEIKPNGLTFKKRTYEDLKTAADANLFAAMELLHECDSKRFLKDTQRMYIMNSMSYLSALFTQDYSNKFIYNEVSDYKAFYCDWFSLYKPLSTIHRFQMISLRLPTFIAMFLIKTFWKLKKMKNGKTDS